MSEAGDILREMRICKPPEALASAGSSAAEVAVEPSVLDATIAQARRLCGLLQWAISFPAMLGMLLVGAVFVAGSTFSVDPDLWWHIRVGQEILSTHHWPTTDPYSFTVAGQPWMAYEWLGEVLLGGIARIAGLQGLMALLIVLASAVILALYGYITLRSGNS
jgi:hypothetical protein